MAVCKNGTACAVPYRILTAGPFKRAGVRLQAYLAPVSNHLAMMPRSSSVMVASECGPSAQRGSIES